MSNLSINSQNSLLGTSLSNFSQYDQTQIVGSISKLFEKEKHLLVIIAFAKHGNAVVEPKLKKEIAVLNKVAETALISKITTALERGDFIAAERECKEFLAVYPDDRGVLSLKERAEKLFTIKDAYEKGNYVKVIRACDEFISFFSADSQVLFFKKNAISFQFKLEAAEEALKRRQFYLSLLYINAVLEACEDHPEAREIGRLAAIGQDKASLLRKMQERYGNSSLWLTLFPELSLRTTVDPLEVALNEVTYCFDAGDFTSAKRKAASFLADLFLPEPYLSRLTILHDQSIKCVENFLKIEEELQRENYAAAAGLFNYLRIANSQALNLDVIKKFFDNGKYECVIQEVCKLRQNPDLTESTLESLSVYLKDSYLLIMQGKFREGKFTEVLDLINQFLEVLPTNQTLETFQNLTRTFQAKRKMIETAIRYERFCTAELFVPDLLRNFSHVVEIKQLHEIPIRISLKRSERTSCFSLYPHGIQMIELIKRAYLVGDYESVIRLWTHFESWNETLTSEIKPLLEKTRIEKALLDQFKTALENQEFEKADQLSQQLADTYLKDLPITNNWIAVCGWQVGDLVSDIATMFSGSDAGRNRTE